MTDDIKPEVIKKTQESLGKFIKKPVLTEKLLTKPPFRFLHDICTAAMRETGFFEGILSPTDCKADNIKDKDGKIAFLQKVIAGVEAANGVKLTIKPGKVVAGHEPTRTNEFLQALGKALEKHTAGHEGNATKSKTDANQTKVKSKPAKRPEKEETVPKKKTSSTKLTKSEKTADTKGNNDSKNKGTSDKVAPSSKQETSRRGEKISPKDRGPSVDRKNEDEKVKRKERSQLKNSQTPSTDSPDMSTESKTAKIKEDTDQQEEINRTEPEQPVDTKRPVSAKPGTRKPLTNSVEHTQPESSPTRELETLEPVKAEPVMTTTPETPAKRPDSSFLKLKKQNSGSGSVTSGYMPKDGGSTEDSPPISRPLTSIRPTTARPASARPAAPRIRDRGEISVHEDVIKQSTGNVQIITDRKDNEPEEDENIVVVEAENDLIQEELGRRDQLDSTQDHSITQGEHGLLVEQILETQKELDQSRLQIMDNKIHGKTEIEWNSSRNKEATEREIKKLRLSIQMLTRSVNPLGKLLDFLQEDVDIMQKELTNWQEMNSNLDVQIAQERSLTEQSVEPLKVYLKEVQQSIEQQLEQITVVKANILRNDQKIHRLLTDVK